MAWVRSGVPRTADAVSKEGLKVLLLLWGVLSAAPYFSLGIKITSLRVPTYVRSGDTVPLKCQINTEGDVLYSVSWWRDNETFFQHNAHNTPRNTAYNQELMRVDLGRSGKEEVVLRNVTVEMSGLYKCEVVADNTFEKGELSNYMQVIDMPDRNPVVRVFQREYRPGDLLRATCLSSNAYPAPRLTWKLNGELVSGNEASLLTDGFSPSFNVTSAKHQSYRSQIRASFRKRFARPLESLNSMTNIGEKISEEVQNEQKRHNADSNFEIQRRKRLDSTGHREEILEREELARSRPSHLRENEPRLQKRGRQTYGGRTTSTDQTYDQSRELDARAHPNPHTSFSEKNFHPFGTNVPFSGANTYGGTHVGKPSLGFGTYSPMSQLSLTLYKRHFVKDRIVLSCVATIGNIYEEKSDYIVYRKGTRSESPFQKLFGSGADSSALTSMLPWLWLPALLLYNLRTARLL